jgi:hypothetical protein
MAQGFSLGNLMIIEYLMVEMGIESGSIKVLLLAIAVACRSLGYYTDGGELPFGLLPCAAARGAGGQVSISP